MTGRGYIGYNWMAYREEGMESFLYSQPSMTSGKYITKVTRMTPNKGPSDLVSCVWLSQVSVSERTHYVCNIFFHWLKSCFVIDWKWDQISLCGPYGQMMCPVDIWWRFNLSLLEHFVLIPMKVSCGADYSQWSLLVCGPLISWWLWQQLLIKGLHHASSYAIHRT